MIVTDKFVFVHLPGSVAHLSLTLSGNSSRQLTKSAIICRDLLPKEYSHLPVLGAARNPWEFYVSWYYYVGPETPRALVSWLTENGKLGFTGSTRNALNLGVNNERLDALDRDAARAC